MNSPSLRFLRRPWSIDRTLCVALGTGLVSPLINKILYREDAFEEFCIQWNRVAPYALFPVFAMFLGLLYWLVDREQFLSGNKAKWTGMITAPLFVLGLIGSVWCYSHHVCMAGHMQHPPYPVWHFLLDAGWVLCLGLAVIWTRMLRFSLCIAFAQVASFLISYRFLFGSLGGIYGWLPL